MTTSPSPDPDAEPGPGLDSVGSVIGSWVLMGFILGVVPLFAAFLRLTDLVQYARSRSGPTGTVTITAGTCDYDDNYSVVCQGSFHPDGGGRPDHPVTVLTDAINAGPRIGARLSTPTSARAWADDYHPGWVGWLVVVLVFGGFGTAMLGYVTIATRDWRRARRASRG